MGNDIWKKHTPMIYGRNTFSVGLRTAQLSESFNKDLKKLLKIKLNVVRFYKYYKNTVVGKHHNKLEAIYNRVMLYMPNRFPEILTGMTWRPMWRPYHRKCSLLVNMI